MSNNRYEELDKLVTLRDYDMAEAFCQSALIDDINTCFWKTQLGYVYFLNERNVNTHYNKTPAIFESLIEKYPDDINAHFWLGYIYNVILNDIENAKNELRIALKLSPVHPYANLVLAGLVEDAEGVELLRKVLTIQSANFRAIRQLADLLLQRHQKVLSRRTSESMLTNAPYIEQDYGIMNRYINDVLTGATHAQAWRVDVQALKGII